MSGKRTKLLRKELESSPKFHTLRGQDKLRTSIVYKRVWRKLKEAYNGKRFK